MSAANILWGRRFDALAAPSPPEPSAAAFPGYTEDGFTADYLAGARDAIGPILGFLDNYFAPWGAWKTEWWEGLDDVEFSDANALLYLHRLARITAPREAASPAPGPSQAMEESK